MPKIKDLTGQKFGRLKVMPAYRHDKKIHTTFWLCKCDCGNFTFVKRTNLISGNTKSCGCYAKQVKKEINTRHDMSDTKFYNTWRSMKGRCLNPNNHKYPSYGGRGITICNSWLVFENFMEDMYELYLGHCSEYGEDNTQLDRINNNGNYEPNNCKWSTRVEQATNRRDSRWFKSTSPEGIEYTSNNQSGFAREHNLLQCNIQKCLKNTRKHTGGFTFHYLTPQEIQQLNITQEQ